jgi:hypothetical protein
MSGCGERRVERKKKPERSKRTTERMKKRRNGDQESPDKRVYDKSRWVLFPHEKAFLLVIDGNESKIPFLLCLSASYNLSVSRKADLRKVDMPYRSKFALLADWALALVTVTGCVSPAQERAATHKVSAFVDETRGTELLALSFLDDAKAEITLRAPGLQGRDTYTLCLAEADAACRDTFTRSHKAQVSFYDDGSDAYNNGYLLGLAIDPAMGLLYGQMMQKEARGMKTELRTVTDETCVGAACSPERRAEADQLRAVVQKAIGSQEKPALDVVVSFFKRWFGPTKAATFGLR